MLNPSPPSHGLLFFSVLFRSDLFSFNTIEDRIAQLYGEAIRFKPKFNPLVSYYEKEMGIGSPLERYFFVSPDPKPREFLLSTKLLSLNWERDWSVDQKRQVNIDVGFISLENLILATTKNFSHRVYLGQSIYADLTYVAQDGTFNVLPWTYPDYKDQEKIDFFNWCRSFILQKNK